MSAVLFGNLQGKTHAICTFCKRTYREKHHFYPYLFCHWLHGSDLHIVCDVDFCCRRLLHFRLHRDKQSQAGMSSRVFIKMLGGKVKAINNNADVDNDSNNLNLLSNPRTSLHLFSHRRTVYVVHFIGVIRKLVISPYFYFAHQNLLGKCVTSSVAVLLILPLWLYFMLGETVKN